MKVFMGLEETAGFFSQLKKGFDEIGIPCSFLELWVHPFQYGPPVSDPLVRRMRHLSTRRSTASHKNLFVRTWWAVLQKGLLMWTIFRYDVFIFNGNNTFWAFRELPILKLLHKRVIRVYLGTDSRPDYLSYYGTKMTTEEIARRTRDKKERFLFLERYTDVNIQVPTYAHLWERPLVNFHRLGYPYSSETTGETEDSASDKKTVRILHAPSNPDLKGTPVIEQAIKNLEAKGHSIEFIKLTGKPNAVVLEELKLCDFVVDQIYADEPVTVFGTEAAFIGKPTVIGGYAQTTAHQMLQDTYFFPALHCRPEETEASIEKMIVDRDFRLALGARAQEFVRTRWSPKSVAEKYLRLIQGDFPPDWLFDPRDIRYVHGVGLPESRVKLLIKSVVEAGGRAALQVHDKPDLEKRLVDFAGSESTPGMTDHGHEVLA